MTNVTTSIGEMNKIKSPTRRKMLHEQIYDQYGIDTNKIYENAEALKIIPIEWKAEIIILTIKSCVTKRIHENINKTEKIFSLGFENSKDCEDFYKEFNMNIPKTINNYISSKGENPKKYNRILVIESLIENLQLIFTC